MSAKATVPSKVKSTKEAATPLNDVPRPSTETLVHTDLNDTNLRRLEYLRSGNDADCEVHVLKLKDCDREGSVCYQKFKCHRLFLATASEKLEQDVLKNKSWNGVLQINRVSPESVEIFLEFAYTFDVQTSRIDLRLISEIFILLGAYKLPELLHQFTQKLHNISLRLESIFPAYNLAFQHNLHDLENSCITKGQQSLNPSIKDLQTYAFNYVIQYWLATGALSTDEIIQILQQYQKEKNLTLNSQHLLHFIKIY